MAVFEGVRIVDPNKIKFINKTPIEDKDWLVSAFMIRDQDVEDKNKEFLYFSTADVKFTDSSLGGSRAINPKPQHTRTADIRRRGRRFDRNKVKVNSRSGNFGMGRMYSEAQDDNAVQLVVSYGIPEFQSFFTYLSRAVDLPASNFANKGRSSFFYDLGTGLGAAFLLVAFPGAFIVLYGIKSLNKLIQSSSRDDYYQLKPMPHLFWKNVNTLVGYLASNLGLIKPRLKDGDNDNIGAPLEINQEDMNKMKEIAPHIFTEDGFIDVYAIANKTNVIINKQLKAEAQLLSKDKITAEELKSFYSESIAPDSSNTFRNLLEEIKGNKSYTMKDETPPSSENDLKKVKPDSGVDQSKYTDKQEDQTFIRSAFESTDGYISDMFDYFKEQSSHGGQYVTYEVEHIGTSTNSWSNSFKDIPIKSKFNSMGGASRDLKFSVAGGNILGDTVGSIANAVGDLALGTLDGLTGGVSNVIKALLGGGFINFPQMWDDSSVDLATHTFKTTLISPYGHPLSSLQALYIPIACFLASILPLGTGRYSYTSPNICSAYIKGLVDIRLGMFKDLSITSGVSNLPYDKSHRPLSFDVTFSIIDLSPMMTSPINSGVNSLFDMTFDDSKSLNRYMNTLTARSQESLVYLTPRVMLAVTRAKMTVAQMTSPAYLGMLAGDTFLGSIQMLLLENNDLNSLQGF